MLRRELMIWRSPDRSDGKMNRMSALTILLADNAYLVAERPNPSLLAEVE